MWPSWLNSPRRRNTSSKHRSFSFSCSSFKDVQSLCEEPVCAPTSPKSPSFFRRIRVSLSLLRSSSTRVQSLPTRIVASSPVSSITLPEHDRQGIVIYYTSLRVVRKTFDDCAKVRSILRGFRVSIDERDVSMDDSFLVELQEILGRKCVSLPKVFIGAFYVGGTEEMVRLQESGELMKLIERLPVIKPNICGCCGGLRFVVCVECDGSHKVYKEKFGFKTCTACNVNGLIRCPSCSYMPLHHTK